MDKRDPEALAAIGGRIRQRRRELNLTQEVLAENAEVSKSFVSEIEGGRTSASGLIYLRIANTLDVSVEWILTGELPEMPMIKQERIAIPGFVAELAEEEGWSYGETLDVAAALQTVVARRSKGRGWEPGREELRALAAAVRRLRPDRVPDKRGR